MAAAKFTMSQEGGYTDDPNDHGGETNLGITESEYHAFFPSIPFGVRSITQDEALEIYKKSYWDSMNLDAVAGPLSCMLFDTGVNMGTHTAVMMLQNIIGATEDGVIGPHTLADIAAYVKQNSPDVLLTHYTTARVLRYHEIATGRGQSGFLNGWLNRANSCLEFCTKTK